ncbi:CD5 protein, partial [Penelope pileata]|nr:CD5 protein [Penelope pileata]
LRLTGSGCRCAGRLEVNVGTGWSPACRDGLNQSSVCQQLGCGPLVTTELHLPPPGREGPRALVMKCVGMERCRWEKANCSQHAAFACSKPETPTTEPPPLPETTSPEPTGPPWLRLVGGNFSCSGFVELHLQGQWGAVALSLDSWPQLPTRICHALGCGDPIADPIADPIGDPIGGSMPQTSWSHLPVRWEGTESCTNLELFNCFTPTDHGHGTAPTFLICQGSQPRASRRLASGPTPCEGDIEVFHGGHWHVLCDNRAHRSERGHQLCSELRCGPLSSVTEIRDPPANGVTCSARHLHLCPQSFGKPRACTRTRVVCEDSRPRPAGTAPGTVASICLALLLLGVLLLICGPPAYRRVVKRISKKKQRQWIGPTGLHQSVSFHRNSTVAPRVQAEGQRAQGGDNDYAQPPQKSSGASAYPALEGATRASSAMDNSSDSDYDLHSARRL